MSLEAALAENTAALKELTAAVLAGGTPEKKPRGKKAAEETAAPAGASAATPAATAPAAGTQATPTQPAQQPTPPAQTAAPANTDLQVAATEAVMKLANDYSRDEAVAILTKFGAGRCGELKAADWQPALDLASAAIKAHEAKKANASLI